MHSYPPVYHEPRNFSERCSNASSKLLLVLRDPHEAIPRWFNVFNEHEGPLSKEARRDRLLLDSRVPAPPPPSLSPLRSSHSRCRC